MKEGKILVVSQENDTFIFKSSFSSTFFCSLLCCYCCIIQRRAKTIPSLRACVLCIRGRACFARLQQMSISLSLAGAKWLFRCMILQGVFPLQSAEAAINARGHIWLLDSRGSSCHTTMLDLAGIYCESLCVCMSVCVFAYFQQSGRGL